MFRFLIAAILGAVALAAQPLPSEARLQQEIKKYEGITRDNPKDIEFWHDLAGLYRQAELWDKAMNAETQAITRHPKYAVAFYGRAKARMGKEDYAGAIEDFTASIKLFEARGGIELYITAEQPIDEYVDDYRTRAMAQAHLNKYKEAITDIGAANKLQKDNPKLLFESGYLKEKAGLKKEAIPDYKRAGLIYADGFAKAAAQECVARLDGLGAKADADAIRLKIAPKTPRTDLPK